ncbi:SKP1-like protein 21 [Acorus calamus]|uniref:SKP1-like protein 21 n=1 Tax=Acorus calamus TaxID=4465 RepID=A0AAV9CPZ0_ACOCL|nr:SKP1-like protein 21 [Acorus calamus]
MEIIKQENEHIRSSMFPQAMKSFIWVQTVDGSIQQVEEEVAMFCPMICQERLNKGTGSSKNYAISLPEQVSTQNLSLILDYCRFHQVPGHSDKERKAFDEKFTRIDIVQLCHLSSAADSLQLKPLVDLTGRALARMLEDKTPEEIRVIFQLPDDLTENVEVKEEQVDERPIEDLLSYINGEDSAIDSIIVFIGETSVSLCLYLTDVRCHAQSGQNQNFFVSNKLVDDYSMGDIISSIREESGALHNECSAVEAGNIKSQAPTPHMSSGSQDSGDSAFISGADFEDGDIDDELDPVMKEKIDREVELFKKRLNLNWSERMQEMLSSSQEQRVATISTMNRNGFSRRYNRTKPSKNGRKDKS